MKNMLPLAIGTIIGCALLSACGRPEGAMKVLVRNSSYEIEVLEPTSPVTGTEYKVVFRVTKDGEPRDVGEDARMLHAALASADYEDVMHTVFLNRTSVGTYEFPHTFMRSGPYRFWVEIDSVQTSQHHGAYADLIAYKDLNVSGADIPVQTLVEGGKAETNGLTAEIFPASLKAGEPLTLQFAVTENGVPVQFTGSESTMYVLVGEGFGFFRHGHFTTSEDGHSSTLGNTFAKPGRYVLWIDVTVMTGSGEFKQVVTPFLLVVS